MVLPDFRKISLDLNGKGADTANPLKTSVLGGYHIDRLIDMR